jgi:hypothetical protein
MNSGNRLSKHRHDHSVGRISAWELHVVGELIGWNTLQNELTSISVFAFIALQWNSKEPNSDGNNEAKNDYRQNPPPSAESLVAIVNRMSHKSCYSDEKREVATRAFGIMPAPQIPRSFPVLTKLQRGKSPFASIRMTRG